MPQGGLSDPGLSTLQSQPTGRPGQWGFVNAPAGSMAGIEALQQQLMPQPGREGGFSSTGLQGSANIPWAVTKDEKTYVLSWLLIIAYMMVYSKLGMVLERALLVAKLLSRCLAKVVFQDKI